MADRDQCFKNIKEAAKDFLKGLSKADTDHFINKILDTAEKINEIAEGRALKGENKKRVVQSMLGDYLKEQKISNERYLIEKKMDKVKMDKILNKIEALGDDPTKAFESLGAELVGGVKSRTGEANSVWQKSLVLKTKYIDIIDQLKHKELYDVFASGEKDLNVAKEIYELSRDGGAPGVSKDAGALEIAKVVHRFNQEILLDKQDAGILVRNMPGYIAKEVHDKTRISVAGFEKWSKKIIGYLDEAKVFKGNLDAAAKIKVLRAAYDNITIGQKAKAIESGESPLITLAGKKQATAHGLSSERILHFKDAESWYKYNQEFGANSLYESIFRSITDETRKISFVDKFGTDPATAFKAIETKLHVKYQQKLHGAMRDLEANTDPSLQKGLEEKVAFAEKEQQRFKGKVKLRMLDAQFKEAEGATSVGADNLLNNVVTAITSWNNVKLLGKATTSLITDPVHVGWNLATALGDSSMTRATLQAITEFSKVFSGAERKLFLDALGIHSENTTMAIHNDIHGDAVKPGMMAKGLEVFFKSTGLSQVSETTRFAVTKTMADILTKYRTLDFDTLNHQTGNTFARFEITKDVWDIIRQGVIEIPSKDGAYEIITPSGIRTAPNPEGVDPRVWRRQKEDAATKYAMLLNNFADMSSLTSTGRSRALLLQGTSPGTPINAALKIMSQLKTPGVQIFNMLRQGIHNNSSVPHDSAFRAMGDMNNVRTLSQFIPLMMTAGYVSLSAKALLNGESPPDPTKPQVAMDVAIRSGVGGIYGDVMFGEYDRTFRTFSADIMGPTAQTANDITKIWAKGIRGEKIGKDAFNFALKSIPGNNHIIFRPLLDIAILNHHQEDSNPGYFNRRNRRLEEERGSHLIGR